MLINNAHVLQIFTWYPAFCILGANPLSVSFFTHSVPPHWPRYRMEVSRYGLQKGILTDWVPEMLLLKVPEL